MLRNASLQQSIEDKWLFMPLTMPTNSEIKPKNRSPRTSKSGNWPDHVSQQDLRYGNLRIFAIAEFYAARAHRRIYGVLGISVYEFF